MIGKTSIVFIVFTVIIVPAHFYCVNRPDMCPKHQEAADCCGCCGTASVLPMIESRISDQRPYTHRYEDDGDDSSEEIQDPHHHRLPFDFFDKSEESPSTKLAKQKNIDVGILNMDDSIKTVQDFADLSSEELVVGNSSKKAWQANPFVKPKFLPDVLATSEGRVGLQDTSESVLDIPPSIPDAVEREMSGLPIETADIHNVEIDEISIGKAPEVVLSNIASKPMKELTDDILLEGSPNSTSMPIVSIPPTLIKETQDASNTIKKRGEDRNARVNKSKKNTKRKVETKKKMVPTSEHPIETSTRSSIE